MDQELLLKQKLAETGNICREGFGRSSILENMETKVTEVMELQQMNYDLQAQLRLSQDTMKLMEAEFAFQRSQLEEEIESRKRHEAQLEAALLRANSERSPEDEDEGGDTEKLKALVVHLQNRIDRRDAKIAALEEQLRNAKPEQQAPVLETEKLRNRLARAKSQIEKARQIEVENKLLEDRLMHCEGEFDIINDMLCIDKRCEITDEWIPVRKEIQSLIKNSEKLRETEELLRQTNAKFEDLQKRLKDEHARQMEVITANTVTRERKMEELEETNRRIGKFVEQQKIRVDFARTISQNCNDVMTKVGTLQNAILPGSVQRELRPLILSAVFVMRWSRIHQRKGETPYDASSLLAFATVPPVTFSEQIDNIVASFTDLTSASVVLKQKLKEAKSEAIEMKNKINQLSSKTGEGMTEVGNLRNMIETQKERMAKLQKETAHAIPPDKFQQMLSNVTNLEIELDQKNEEIVTLNDIIEEKTELLNAQSTKIRELNAEREARLDELSDIKSICDNRCHEIELLKMKLKDKTKELLALERIIDHVKPILPSIIAIEVPNDSEESSTAPPSMMDCADVTEIINPSFLGKL